MNKIAAFTVLNGLIETIHKHTLTKTKRIIILELSSYYSVYVFLAILSGW